MGFLRRNFNNGFDQKLSFFELWLLSLPENELSLSRIAMQVVETFDVTYCSIHAHSNKYSWRSPSGLALGNIGGCSQLLNVEKDHFAGTQELAEEQELGGIRNFAIRAAGEIRGLLVVKSKALSDDQIRMIAALISIRIQDVQETA